MGQQWYDWFVYANFALYFAGQFFPEGDRTAQLMNTAAVFAVGFLARPLGGGCSVESPTGKAQARVDPVGDHDVVQRAADRRRSAHQQGGYLGAVLLLVARIMQGLSVGGSTRPAPPT